MKMAWDLCTVLVSGIHAYKTHTAIRDRTFEIPYTNTIQICLELWFICDILLNFITEHRLGTVTLRTVSAIAARYLTTWFVIDVLSLIPGEWLFVRPVIQRLHARGRIQKWMARTKAITRVTTKLVHRWTILRQVSSVYRRQMGIGGVARLVRTCIRYIPKYILFLRNMKAVVAVRILRQWHWMRKVYYNIYVAMEAGSHGKKNPTNLIDATGTLSPVILRSVSLSRSPSLENHSSRHSSSSHYHHHQQQEHFPNDPPDDPILVSSYSIATPMVIPSSRLDDPWCDNQHPEETSVHNPRTESNPGSLGDDDDDDNSNDDHEFENSRVILFQDSDNEANDDEIIQAQQEDSYFFDDGEVDDDDDDDDSPY